MRKLLALVAAGVLAVSGVAQAQSESTSVHPPGVPSVPNGRRGGRIRALSGGDGAGKDGAARGNRQALAKQVRQAFAGVVRRELNLNDEQVRRLQTTDQRFQRERNQIGRDERQTRVALASALADSTGTPDQAKISQYMDQLVQAQHKRADLLESEQKELGTFLTPLQRARYQALREQLGRRVQQLRQQGAARRGLPPG